MRHLVHDDLVVEVVAEAAAPARLCCRADAVAFGAEAIIVNVHCPSFFFVSWQGFCNKKKTKKKKEKEARFEVH
jgi:hypothetical protein